MFDYIPKKSIILKESSNLAMKLPYGDKVGNLRYQTDGNGNTASYTYDALNRKVSASIAVTDCEDNTATQTTTYGYDANGNLTSEQNWRGNTYGYVYDALNRLIEKTDPNGATIEKLVYNDNSAQVYSIDALNNTTEFVYDRNGRLTETIDALGNSQCQYYDGAGNVIHAEDANGNDTYYTYDGLNRLTAVLNALNETTSYTYDNAGNQLTQTDGRGNVTTIQYNCRNLPTMRIDAGGILPDQTIDETKATSFTYYAGGNAETQTDRNGLTTSYTYDIHGRLLSQSAGTDTISYTYDNNSNQLTVTNSSGTITREYDELGRVISKTISGQGTFTYQYDVTTGIAAYFTGQITTDPKGNVSTSVYDRVGRLYQVIADSVTTSYTYFDNGTRESITYPNGLTAEYTYYANNKLHTLANKNGSTIIEAFNYSYDDNGNMSSKLDGKGTTSFTYDALNRLATITEPDGTVTEYTYDEAGNRTGEDVTLNGVTTSTDYTYNMQNRLTATEEVPNGGQTETTDYFYDNNGNTVSTQVQSIDDAAYDYDGFNQLTEATQDGSTMQMAYNGEGLRISKEVSANGQSSVVQYLYEYNKVVLELNGNGVQTAYNIYGNDTLISRETGGEKLYYLYNGHDVTALTDGTGAVVASYYYDAFGNITEETGSANNSVNYAGYQYDAETGMYYLNARYYNPVTARFMTEDTYYGSVSDPLSLNLYTYCANNPIIYWDPTGHVVTEWDLEHCSASEIATIIEATEAWNAANAAGDTAAMDAAHQMAEDARNHHLGEGETVGDEGYVYDYDSPAAGGNEDAFSNIRELAATAIENRAKDAIKNIGVKSTDEVNSYAASLPPTGEPNSTGKLYNPDGSLKQVREYGPDGKAKKDTDYSDHGNPKEHPDVPHEHDWDWSKNPPRGDDKPVNKKQETANSSSSIWTKIAGVGIVAIGVIGTGILILDDATGIGTLDDPAIGITGGMVTKGIQMIFG